MVAWFIRLIVFLTCGPLWRLGGWGTEGQYPNPVPWTGWRDTVIPILCGLVFGWDSKNWFIAGLSFLAAMIIRLGYGENSIFQHSLGLDNIQARALCGLCYGLIAFLPIAWYTKDWYDYALFACLLCLCNFYVVYFQIADVQTELFLGWVFGLAFLLFIKKS